MTTDKARKKATRTRMAKTGERYTSARRHVVRTTPVAEPVTDDLGVSDEAVLRGSGKSWKQWLRLLDEWAAASRMHREIARHVHDEHGVDGWWAQTVTVGYERARGLRRVNQRPEGSYCAYVSKTFPVDATTLSRAFTEARRRNRWLEPGVLRVRTSQPGRSARFDDTDGWGRVSAWFTAKGEQKSTALQRLGLPGARGAGHQAVPIHHRQRKPHRRARRHLPTEHRRAQQQRRLVERVPLGHLLQEAVVHGPGA